jgi:hypothetical protein
MAKQKLKDAVDEAVRHRATEEIKNDVLQNVQRIAAQEAAAAEKLKEEEAAARSARKAALNNAWMSKIPQCESCILLSAVSPAVSGSLRVSYATKIELFS